MTSLLMSTQLNEEQQDFVKTIRVSGEILLVVINDILDFSKMEAGRIDLETQPFDLVAALDDVIDLLMPNARAKALTLNYAMEPDVPHWLHGDVTRIRQVLVNLVSNAVKFTDRGEVQVSVRQTAVGSGVLKLEFCVRDTGMGMSPDTVQRLFTAFTQADTSTSRKFGGTGLGLAISQRLARLMGGDIRVESQIQTGSRFYFSLQTTALPAMGEDTQTRLVAGTLQGKSKATDSIFDTSLATRLPLRLLVVEDHEINQKVLLRILQRFGYSVVDVAANGREAVDAVLRQRYDIVFMDQQMPVMDGLDATRAIVAQLGKAASPKIIALTADAMPDARNACLDAGMDDYVSKPVLPQTLQAIIEKWGGQGGAGKDTGKSEQAKQDGLPVLDTSVTAMLLEMDASGNWLASLVKHYAEPDVGLATAMRQAAAERNEKGLVSALHGLRGISGTIGAQRVLALIQNIESSCKAGQFSDVESWVGQLVDAREQASNALVALLPKAHVSV